MNPQLKAPLNIQSEGVSGRDIQLSPISKLNETSIPLTTSPTPSFSGHNASQEEANTHKSKISFQDLLHQSQSSKKASSRSNHSIKTPEFVNEDTEDRLNLKLGEEFYKTNPWVCRKSAQYHPDERKQLIDVMGYAAHQIIDQFPPWWSFLFPTDETDRKNWSLVRNGVTYVSTSKAVRNNGITFINNSTTLDICPICSKVMNHKALVYMRYIVWKEKYTGSDLLNWMTVNQKACYVHWRSYD